MKANIKIVCSNGMSLKALTKLETELNDLLEIGYTLQGSPLGDGNGLIYTLLRPADKERIRNATAYPSDKQIGYVGWAYNLPENSQILSTVSRSEASALIQHHKELSEGLQLADGGNIIVTQLEIIRADVEVLTPSTIEPTKKTGREPLPPFDGDDDDLPF